MRRARATRRSTSANSSPPTSALSVARAASASGGRPRESIENTEASHCTSSASATAASSTTSARAAVVAIRKRPAREADREAHHQLGERRQPEHAPAEHHVLHPAGRGAGEHAVRLAEASAQ